VVDRQSAFEVLAEKTKRKQDDEERQRQVDAATKAERTYHEDAPRSAPRRSTRQTPTEAAVNSFTRSIATQLGHALVRGILGSLKRGR
jgi:hypothetical protein